MNLYDSIGELDPKEKIDYRIIQRVTNHHFFKSFAALQAAQRISGSKLGTIDDDETSTYLSAQKVS